MRRRVLGVLLIIAAPVAIAIGHPAATPPARPPRDPATFTITR
jgi:hypothetical protein